MKNRITAFLLSVVLCLSLVGTAFAADSSDRVTFTLDKEAQTVTMDITGLTPGRTYRLCSLGLKEVAATPAATEFTALRVLDNITADMSGNATVIADGIRSSIFTDGNVLRLHMVDPDGNWDADYTIGQEEPVEMATVTIYDGYNRAVNSTAGDVQLVEFQVEKGSQLTERDLLAKITNMPSHAGYHRNGWLSGGSTVQFPMTISADVVSVVMLWAKNSSGNNDNSPSYGGGSGGSSSPSKVSVDRSPNGSVTYRPSSPKAGDTVTITVRPNSGFELDSITVTTENGRTVRLTKVNDTTYTFVMPDGRVEINPVFKAAASTPTAPSFRDVPSSHAFYGDISWVASQGYMGGYSDGSFRPGANTTRQALWMVLARIDGASPSDMNAARSWATRNGVSDGSNPGGAMSRQQMVTMLYRYAQSKGYKTTGGVSLSGFADAPSVASYAQDAMSWAVGNGIVQGTGNGTLNPTGTATRAHFAAFLHRFCTSVGIA